MGYVDVGTYKNFESCERYTCTCSGEKTIDLPLIDLINGKYTSTITHMPCQYEVATMGGYVSCYDRRRCEVIYKEPCQPTAVLKRNHEKPCPGGSCMIG